MDTQSWLYRGTFLHMSSIRSAEVGVGDDDIITNNTMQSTRFLADSIELMNYRLY